jgi:hypothetical protein
MNLFEDVQVQMGWDIQGMVVVALAVIVFVGSYL